MVTFTPGMGNGASPGGTCLVKFKIRVPNPATLRGRMVLAEPVRRICAEAWARTVLAQFKPQIVEGALAPFKEAVTQARSAEEWLRLKEAFDSTDAWEQLRAWIIRSVCADLVMEFQDKVWPALWEEILKQFAAAESSEVTYEYEVSDTIRIFAQLKPQVIEGGGVSVNIASAISFAHSVKISDLKPVAIALGDD